MLKYSGRENPLPMPHWVKKTWELETETEMSGLIFGEHQHACLERWRKACASQKQFLVSKSAFVKWMLKQAIHFVLEC